MWEIIRNFFIVLTLVSVIAVPAFLTFTAEAEEHCQVQIGAGGIGIVVCGGEVVEQLPLPTIKITVPGPTVTDIVKLPGATETITETKTVPGPTQTVTADGQPVPGPTVTVPGPTTVIESPRTIPGPTSFATKTIGPTEAPERVQEDAGASGIAKAGIGFLSLILALIAMVVMMYLGYILGYRDADRENADFYKALMDVIKSRRK